MEVVQEERRPALIEEMREKLVMIASSPAYTTLLAYSPFQGSFGLSSFRFVTVTYLLLL